MRCRRCSGVISGTSRCSDSSDDQRRLDQGLSIVAGATKLCNSCYTIKQGSHAAASASAAHAPMPLSATTADDAFALGPIVTGAAATPLASKQKQSRSRSPAVAAASSASASSAAPPSLATMLQQQTAATAAAAAAASAKGASKRARPSPAAATAASSSSSSAAAGAAAAAPASPASSFSRGSSSSSSVVEKAALSDSESESASAASESSRKRSRAADHSAASTLSRSSSCASSSWHSPARALPAAAAAATHSWKEAGSASDSESSMRGEGPARCPFAFTLPLLSAAALRELHARVSYTSTTLTRRGEDPYAHSYRALYPVSKLLDDETAHAMEEQEQASAALKHLRWECSCAEAAHPAGHDRPSPHDLKELGLGKDTGVGVLTSLSSRHFSVDDASLRAHPLIRHLCSIPSLPPVDERYLTEGSPHNRRPPPLHLVLTPPPPNQLAPLSQTNESDVFARMVTSLDGAAAEAGSFHGLISYRQYPANCDKPFGTIAAGMLRCMARQRGLRLFQDVQDTVGGGNWNTEIHSVLQSSRFLIVLIWSHCFDRCSDEEDAFANEIVTAARMLHVAVVPVVVFDEAQSCTPASFLAAAEAVRLNKRVTPLQTRLNTIYEAIFSQHMQFVRANTLEQDLNKVLDSLPALIGVRAPGRDTLSLFDHLGVTLHMSDERLWDCFVKFVQTNRSSNEATLASVRALTAGPGSGQMSLSVLSWNLHGGVDRSHPEQRVTRDEQLALIGKTKADVLCLQEATHSILIALERTGYTVHRQLVYSERYKGSQYISEDGTDVSDLSYLHQSYLAIAVRSSLPHTALEPQELSRDKDNTDGDEVIAAGRYCLSVRIGSCILHNAHCIVDNESLRREEMQTLIQRMDGLAGNSPVNAHGSSESGSSSSTDAESKPAEPEPTATVARLTRRTSGLSRGRGKQSSARAGPPTAVTPNQFLFADLNAISARDCPVPALQAFHKRMEELHRGDMLTAPYDVFECMSYLEQEQQMMDSFEALHLPRPQISVWSCRRVDYALAYRGSHWDFRAAHLLYSSLSDHLPLLTVIQPSSDAPQ